MANRGEKVEVGADFLFLGSKITKDGDCSHEIRRQLLLGRKAMTPKECVEKHRCYSDDKGPYSQAMVFPVVTYSCESWTVKKAEFQRIDVFEQWCWRRLLRVSWTARRSNQSILREINPEYSLEGLMLKLKVKIIQSFLTFCDPMECSTPGLPVPHHLLKFAQFHVHCIGDAIQPFHPLMPSSLSGLYLSQ